MKVIDRKLLSQTNQIWNQSRLNSPYSVGSMVKLINEIKPKTYEEWQEGYFKSGERRLEIIKRSKMTEKEKGYLLCPTPTDLPYSYKKINYEYGRTKECLTRVGFLFYGILLSNKIEISLNEAIKQVYFRVLVETWNGLGENKREQNTTRLLKKLFPCFNYVEPQSIDDIRYGVDKLICYNNSIVAGVQIKPKSYLCNNPGVKDHRKLNQKKFKNFNKPVLVVISNESGFITNYQEVVQFFNKLKQNSLAM